MGCVTVVSAGGKMVLGYWQGEVEYPATSPLRGATCRFRLFAVSFDGCDKISGTNAEGLADTDQRIECGRILVQLHHADVIAAEVRLETQLFLSQSRCHPCFSDFIADHVSNDRA